MCVVRAVMLLKLWFIMTTMPLTGKEESKSDDYSWVHLVEEPKKYSRCSIRIQLFSLHTVIIT